MLGSGSSSVSCSISGSSGVCIVICFSLLSADMVWLPSFSWIFLVMVAVSFPGIVIVSISSWFSSISMEGVCFVVSVFGLYIVSVMVISWSGVAVWVSKSRFVYVTGCCGSNTIIDQ